MRRKWGCTISYALTLPAFGVLMFDISVLLPYFFIPEFITARPLHRVNIKAMCDVSCVF
jgi:hypothetical protein